MSKPDSRLPIIRLETNDENGRNGTVDYLADVEAQQLVSVHDSKQVITLHDENGVILMSLIRNHRVTEH